MTTKSSDQVERVGDGQREQVDVRRQLSHLLDETLSIILHSTSRYSNTTLLVGTELKMKQTVNSLLQVYDAVSRAYL